MFKNSYVSKINQDVYIESQKIFGIAKIFLSVKIIMDKVGGTGTEITKFSTICHIGKQRAKLF